MHSELAAEHNKDTTALGMDIFYNESTIYIVTTVDIPLAVIIVSVARRILPSRCWNEVYKLYLTMWRKKMVMHVRTNDDKNTSRDQSWG